MNTCDKCNGDMIGDGYTTVMHCEYADEGKLMYLEPDASPVLCDYKDAKGKTNGTNYKGDKTNGTNNKF